MTNKAPKKERATPLILIVDDEPEIRKLLRDFLEREGFAVDEASNGATGLTKAMEVRPDVMLLDQRLPDFAGIEIHQHLVTVGIKIPTVMMSQHPGADQMRKLHHIQYFVPKPLDFKEMVAAIRQLLKPGK